MYARMLRAACLQIVAPKRAALLEAEGTYATVMEGLQAKQTELRVSCKRLANASCQPKLKAAVASLCTHAKLHTAPTAPNHRAPLFFGSSVQLCHVLHGW